MAPKQTNEFCYFNTDQHLKSSLSLAEGIHQEDSETVTSILYRGQTVSGVKVKSTEQLTLQSATVSHIGILKDKKSFHLNNTSANLYGMANLPFSLSDSK